MTQWEPTLGANVLGHATRFRVWAPDVSVVEVVIETPGREPAVVPMLPAAGGFHSLTLPGIAAGDLYRYRPSGRGPLPDPASRFQPFGVHGPSQVVDWRHFPWTDSAFTGHPLEDTVFYELHTGAFTSEGTFAAACSRLPYLRDLGITAIQLMPVADFAGNRNWGYDGVAPFAPARCYGRPDDLRAFVNQAHRLGLSVYLDVVYNHLGPDGAYQATFSPYYYSKTHNSPWGAGINFDGPLCEPVRDYFIENALRWIHEYHIDGLRLDSTHAIVDRSHRHILASISGAVHASLEGSPRRVHVIAEDNCNHAHLIKPESCAGFGLDGVWADDFHHHMRRALAGDSDGYFQDFDGTAAHIAATARQGWFFTGQHSSYFGHPRGTDPSGIPLSRFVVCLQNHDQIGNRAFGDRLHHQIDLAAWRAASALLLLLPETPLLFMGQEWAASSPFQYFTDHHRELGMLVTEGRREEFSRFTAFSDPGSRERIPDPQSPETFLASRLHWDERAAEPHASILRLYHRLLTLRRGPALRYAPDSVFEFEAVDAASLLLRRAAPDGSAILAAIRLRGSGTVQLQPGGTPRLLFTTEDPSYSPDPWPIAIGECSKRDLTVAFQRPGAAVFQLRAGPSYPETPD